MLLVVFVPYLQMKMLLHPSHLISSVLNRTIIHCVLILKML